MMIMKNTISKRVWKLSIILILGFSLVWLVPNTGEFQKSLLKSSLPETSGRWTGSELPISGEELKILAEDTTFARKRYFSSIGKTRIPISVSVVFSGKDINNSIHRPEVCLRAQGFSIKLERYLEVENVTPEGNSIEMKEMVSLRPRTKVNYPNSYKNAQGEVIYDQQIQYYAFIGADKAVAGHYERSWEDIKNRLMKGEDQQWAYITISAPETQSLIDQGLNLGASFEPADIEETRKILTGFMSELLPEILEREPK